MNEIEDLQLADYLLKFHLEDSRTPVRKTAKTRKLERYAEAVKEELLSGVSTPLATEAIAYVLTGGGKVIDYHYVPGEAEYDLDGEAQECDY